MDKLPVGQLPDLQQSNNDDEIMVITNSEYNQLKKEKISDLITDFTSTNENNALTKGTDGKMFVTDFGNASNITEGTLPTSVLPEIPLEKIPDIPKDKLPPIETADLPVSGVSADTYAYPSSVTVNAQGQVTAIEEGTPSGANANTDLSNITEAGKEVIRQTAGLGEITEALVDKVNAAQASSAAMPSNSGQSLSWPSSGSVFTAPTDGYYHARGYSQTSAWASLSLDNIEGKLSSQEVVAGIAGSGLSVYLPAAKGQRVSLHYENLGDWPTNNVYREFRFIPTKGAAGEV